MNEEPCYIVGGGSSLIDFNWSLLDDKFVIAINRAYEVLPKADVIFFTDTHFYENHKQNLLNHTAKKIRGIHSYIRNRPDRVSILYKEFSTHRGLSPDPNKLCFGKNSGYAAIDLATKLGFTKIYLLGFDMQGPHWHNGYLRTASNDILKNQILPYFDDLILPLKEKNIQVINTNPKSLLKVFPIENIFEKQKYIQPDIDKNIICVKIGTRYSSEYVNKLSLMIKRNLTYKHRFICLTDNPNGLLEDIEAFPISHKNLPGWWCKLEIFQSPLYDIKGQNLFLDLDTIIVGNIDCFFEHPGNFIMEKDHSNKNLSSCLMRFTVNENSDIYDDFTLNSRCATYSDEKEFGKKHFWGDQVWINEKRPNAETWPEEWVKSFKWECCTPKTINWHGHKTFRIPVGCKVIKFHGTPSIIEAIKYVGEFWQ